MKRQRAQKLQLSKESIRNLDRFLQAGIEGGIIGSRLCHLTPDIKRISDRSPYECDPGDYHLSEKYNCKLTGNQCPSKFKKRCQTDDR